MNNLFSQLEIKKEFADSIRELEELEKDYYIQADKNYKKSNARFLEAMSKEERKQFTSAFGELEI